MARVIFPIWAAPIAPTNFNVVTALLGGFISLFGLVSYLLKEHFYLSEALISMVIGVAFGPKGAQFIRPEQYAGCPQNDLSPTQCEANIDAITLDFSRLVLAVQLVLAGVQLRSKYMWLEAKSVLLLVGPGMAMMWIATSLLVWGLLGTPSFLHAMAVGACVTPTDPVLSAVIVKGKFADKNIPKELQDLIVAESGTNDGLGYPWLFLALYLIKYIGAGANPADGGAGQAMGLWFALTWAYVILMSIAYGAVVGLLGQYLLHWAEDRGWVDRESFLVFAISLGLFVLGTCGLIGTDDVLACFVAGNAFTWDDWFRLETKDDSLQPTVDMLLNVSIFLWYGAVIPWDLIAHNDFTSLSRVIPLGFLILLLRRLPWIYGMHKWIHQIDSHRNAIFVGFFGPIGVSAIFYLYIANEFIDRHLSDDNGVPREDVKNLRDTVTVVVWFMVVASVVVHGLSIPLGKLGYLAPRTLSRALSGDVSDAAQSDRPVLPGLGRRIIGIKDDQGQGRDGGVTGTSSRTHSVRERRRDIESGSQQDLSQGAASEPKPSVRREIRFPDDPSTSS
ncbi:Na(+)/H(+) antiporter 2 [Cordyceps fumosorosea ARSEF 2679]|uniref:Na(+)/H(+) antiporter 2 n=1 Tax=Cordyceps fumosorosea (strain ARSEF 2679) TaxID=1081104 RepID=A0A168BVL3_CORFA|nr:Na(+)/H(+) antiporter 2 [Cordyceps fumosorosea ARSEF 2679]OAA70600.1 Na(+)/H(+) antiporter 2 [Cordyceps fumosorosea ARSEF 2679]